MKFAKAHFSLWMKKAGKVDGKSFQKLQLKWYTQMDQHSIWISEQPFTSWTITSDETNFDLHNKIMNFHGNFEKFTSQIIFSKKTSFVSEKRLVCIPSQLHNEVPNGFIIELVFQITMSNFGCTSSAKLCDQLLHCCKTLELSQNAFSKSNSMCWTQWECFASRGITNTSNKVQFVAFIMCHASAWFCRNSKSTHGVAFFHWKFGAFLVWNFAACPIIK